jgi:2-dehydro-3-deoxygalactonokinase
LQRGFETVLESHLAGCPRRGSSVVICGMAGSRQGWVEAGYLDTPADVAAIGENATRGARNLSEIIIIPGLSVRSLNEPDVMRGEETQLLGACLDMPQAGATACRAPIRNGSP